MDPALAMRVIDDQTATTIEQIAYRDDRIYRVWGVAYLLGYLPLALSTGPSRLLDLPLGPVLAFFGVCIVGGVVLSVGESMRASRGVRGEVTLRGALYGLTWWLSFLVTAGVNYRLSKAGLSGDEYGLVINGVTMLVVSALFMAGGAVWHDVRQFVIGAWVAVAVTLALVLGLPAYYWIMCLLVGGGLLLASVLHHPVEAWATRRRARPRS